MLPQPLTSTSLDALDRLRKSPWHVDSFDTDRRSAVLIPLVAADDGSLHVILTQRSQKLRTHSGDVSFPGGKCDPEDVDLVATAKREAFEEIGLTEPYEILTVMAPELSRTLLVVTPVVAFIPSMRASDITKLVANPDEVDAIFTVELAYFLAPESSQYAYFDMDWVASTWRMHRFLGCGSSNHILTFPEQAKKQNGKLPTWNVVGLTANLLIDAAIVAFGYSPTYERHAPGQQTKTDMIETWHKDERRHRQRL